MPINYSPDQGPKHLGYSESLVNFDTTFTGQTTGDYVDIPSLAISFNAGARPYMVEVHVPSAQMISSGNCVVNIGITDSSNDLKCIGTKWYTALSANSFSDLTVKRFFTASPGAKSYKARIAGAAAAKQFRFNAVVTNTTALSPFYIRAWEV